MCLMRDLREDTLIVLYDDDCGFCEVMPAMLLRWDRATRVRPVSIQSPPTSPEPETGVSAPCLSEAAERRALDSLAG